MSKYSKSEEWISIYYKCLNEAWNDQAFAVTLVASPREVLKTRFGYQVPADIELKFVKTTAGGPYPVAQSVTVFDRPEGSAKITFEVPLPDPPPGLVDIEIKGTVQAAALAPTTNLECWCACA